MTETPKPAFPYGDSQLTIPVTNAIISVPTKSSTESENSIAQEIAPAIENVNKFHVFYKSLASQSLWSGNFFELADNGVLSCRKVVGKSSRKWGHFGGA